MNAVHLDRVRPAWPGCTSARVLLACTLLAWRMALASPPAPVPEGSSHAQRFRYDLESSFAILALPGVPTDLQLAPDEHVAGFALGDTLQWVVEELPGHVFVKPLKPDLFTAGTLVTDRRTYQLTLRSGRPRDDWMQRVSWSYPELVILRGPAGVLPHDAERVPAGAEAGAGQPRALAPRIRSADASPGVAPEPGDASRPAPARAGAARSEASGPETAGLDPARLDFDYEIVGEAGFRPRMVFDDGLSTWLRIPPHETLPAIFGEGPDGPQLVNYAVQGEWVVLPKVLPALLLKLGRIEVRVLRRAPAPGSLRPGWPLQGDR